MKYRPEIDGLRAVAVLPVILYHAGFDIVSGGFVGVDVFFVISGYLITSIIIDDISKNQFSLLRFYERRARRILPMLFFTIFMCIIVAPFFLLPNQLKDFAQSVIATSMFASNILFFIESDYFALFADEKPLLHTWSLAVEEQFYFIVPIFILWLHRSRLSIPLFITLGIFISFFISIKLADINPSANFYLLPSRAWELLCGSLCAVAHREIKLNSSSFLSAVGGLCILSSMFLFDGFISYPGIHTLLPVAGTILIILFCKSECLVAKLLSVKPLLILGTSSYSAYLLHQPIFAYFKVYTVRQIDPHYKLLLVITILICAIYCYRYVEQPMRNNNKVSKRAFKFVSILGVGLCFSCGVLMLSFGDRFYANYDFERYTKAVEDWEFPKGLQKHSLPGVYVSDINKEINIVIFGDSHAEQYSTLVKELSAQNRNVALITGGGCPPFPKVYEELHPHCLTLFETLKNFLLLNPEVDKLVFAGCYNCYFRGISQTPNKKKSQTYRYIIKDKNRELLLNSNEGAELALTKFEEMLVFYMNRYHVIVIGDNPNGYQFDPVLMMRRDLGSRYFIERKFPDIYKKDFKVDSEQLLIDNLVKERVHPPAKYVQLINIICPGDECAALDGNDNPIYKDANHMRSSYVKSKFHLLNIFE